MKTLALDIGGANLKAAHSAGGAWKAWSVPFALWKEPGQLAQRLTDLACNAPPFDRVLLTMTAELCDCFNTKREGVSHVLHAVELTAGGREIGVWTTQGRFVSPAEARAQPLKAAASNWHALATYAARLYPTGRSLLMDTGSTTTDIIPLEGGRPAANGLTDLDRLATGELVYSGLLRTPLTSLGPKIRWRGQDIPLMAEFFATIGDVHLLLGTIPEAPERTDTADGRPMTQAAAAARLVRMIGADLEMIPRAEVLELASAFAEKQLEQISEGVRIVAGRKKISRIILAGSGDLLAAAVVAAAFPKGGMPLVRLADQIGPEASAAACAYALLHLAEPVL